jgi:hypothetical protein
MAGSFDFFRRGTVPPELVNYKAPRDEKHINMWVDELNDRQIFSGRELVLNGSLAIDTYISSLECLIIDLDKRLRALEGKR